MTEDEKNVDEMLDAIERDVTSDEEVIVASFWAAVFYRVFGRFLIDQREDRIREVLAMLSDPRNDIGVEIRCAVYDRVDALHARFATLAARDARRRLQSVRRPA